MKKTNPTRGFHLLLEILLVSARLGLTSFGGPTAHLGYFHEEYVRRRKWLDEKSYADLVALAQFLLYQQVVKSASVLALCEAV